MTNYIFLSLLGAFLYSLAGISGKLATKHQVKDLGALIFWLAFSALPLVPILFILSGHIQNPLHSIFPLTLFIVVTAIATYLMWKALYTMEITVFQPLFSAQTIFVAILAYFILHERFSINIYTSLLLAVIGGVLISYSEGTKFKAFFNKGSALMLAVIILFAVSDILVKLNLITGLDPWNFKAWSIVGLFIVFSPVYVASRKQLTASVKQVLPLAANNLFAISAQVAVYNAFKQNVTISQALAMFGGVFTLVIVTAISRFYPKWLEQHSLKVYLVRFVGCVLMLLASVLIVVQNK
ncbi:hypothetical protein A2886_03500 [candidate division WWE3 bacterium RIFCSPHIGHO2_01_FULL_42_13]|uniref:EamA domain-containing protein n=1 Tax=candidate division WWE3 bacterium RIFCSPHIGHO2_01_FULL_42_13 TaxID=1802617 RepID=A0A1F4URD0_UNCKA|nr:MAG: hypothetical protein A2886_03500 [candidate division WWE3 bacterium RIFCSPHIGHO2_01_FULL_42_13]